MNSDDVVAGLAILLGASLPTLVTISVLTRPHPAEATRSRPETIEIMPEPTIVDYAIIRDGVDQMVGPEGPHSGWHGRVEFAPRTR